LKVCFANRDGGSEIWVMLLEKAWAKLHGSYSRIKGGWSTHPAQHLSGLPAENLWHNKVDKDKLWE